jgi:hypothetical protein
MEAPRQRALACELKKHKENVDERCEEKEEKV